jgi:ribosomal protein S18 acetylase RimI-like enzyme
MSRSTRGSDPNFTVRHATRADLAEMGRLGAMLVRTHHEFDSQRFIPATPATERGYASFLGGQLEDPEAVLLVAEGEGRVIGYTYASIEDWDYMALRGPAGVLHDLVVDLTSRGSGVGGALLEATLAELRERGAPRVVLSTASGNNAARGLFEKAGFRTTMVEMTRELGAGGNA